MRVRALLACLLATAACGGGSRGGDDDDVGGDGDADADADADGDPELRCLDADGNPTAVCELEPDRQPCTLDETADCGILTTEEVWADDGEAGPCLRLVIENRCEDVLYTWTCIERQEAPAEPDWQCWLSTTPPGFDVDLSECHATGRYAHYGSLSDGTLDIIDERCNPRP